MEYYKEIRYNELNSSKESDIYVFNASDAQHIDGYILDQKKSRMRR